MSDSTPDSPPLPLPEVFVERILEHTIWYDDDGTAMGLVMVRVYTPVQRAPDKWECTLEYQYADASGPPRRMGFLGEDSIQALFQALRMAENKVGRKYIPTPPDIFVE